jgi:hypothetical protein
MDSVRLDPAHGVLASSNLNESMNDDEGLYDEGQCDSSEKMLCGQLHFRA